MYLAVVDDAALQRCHVVEPQLLRIRQHTSAYVSIRQLVDDAALQRCYAVEPQLLRCRARSVSAYLRPLDTLFR